MSSLRLPENIQQPEKTNFAREVPPLEVFKQAYESGGPETIQTLKQRVLNLESEIQTLKQDKETYIQKYEDLKNNNRDKRLLTVDQREDIENKIKNLESDNKILKEDNEELRLSLVAKQLDLDNLMNQIRSGSANPLFFAKDKTRDDFWKIMTRIQAEQSNLHNEKSQYQVELYEYKAKCLVQQQEIVDLRIKLDSFDSLESEKVLLLENINALLDEKNEQEHFIRETMIRIQAHELTIKQLTDDKQNLTNYSFELQGKLKENTLRAANDKKLLQDGMQELKSQREKINELNKKRAKKQESGKSAILPSKIAYNKKIELPIQDYFVRLNTTSIHHQKYSETVDIILNLLENDKSITNEIENNYKTLLKAFQSKNSNVLLSLHKIVMQVGKIEQKIKLYMESGAATSLVQQYVQNQNMYNRKLILDVLIPLLKGEKNADYTRQIIAYLINFGGIKRSLDDVNYFIKENASDISQQSVDGYIESVFDLMFETTKYGQGVDLILNDMKNLQSLTKSKMLENGKKIAFTKAMRVVRNLASIDIENSGDNIFALNEYDIFNEAYKGVLHSVRYENYDDTIMECLIILSSFTSLEDEGNSAGYGQSRAYYQILSSMESIIPLYQLILQLIDPNEAPESMIPYTQDVDFRVALMRLMKNVVVKNGFKNVKSTTLSQRQVIDFFIIGLADKQRAPKYPVATECIKLIKQSQNYLEQNNQFGQNLLDSLMLWMNCPDSQTLLDIFVSIISLLANDDITLYFIKQGGILSVINAIAARNHNLSKYTNQEPQINVLLHAIIVLSKVINIQEAMDVIYDQNLVQTLLTFFFNGSQAVDRSLFLLIYSLSTQNRILEQIEQFDGLKKFLRMCVSVTYEEQYRSNFFLFINQLARSSFVVSQLVTPQNIEDITKMIEEGMTHEQSTGNAIDTLYRMLFQASKARKLEGAVREKLIRSISQNLAIMKNLIARLADLNLTQQIALFLIDSFTTQKPSVQLLQRTDLVNQLKKLESLSNLKQNAGQNYSSYHNRLKELLEDYKIKLD